MNRQYAKRDADGRWVCITYADQCEGVIGARRLRCQGVAGHSQRCWAYAPNGWYHYQMGDGTVGMVPPGHPHYVEPNDALKDAFTANTAVDVVTDAETLAILNAGGCPHDASRVDAIEELERGGIDDA